MIPGGIHQNPLHGPNGGTVNHKIYNCFVLAFRIHHVIELGGFACFLEIIMYQTMSVWMSRETFIYISRILSSINMIQLGIDSVKDSKVKFQFGRIYLLVVHPTYVDCMLFLTKEY